MNASTRTSTRTSTALRLVVAGPLAASAIVLAGFGVAQADSPVHDPKPGLIIAVPEPSEPKPQGPGEIAQPAPKPDPHPQPKPQGPGDIAQPKDDDDPKPQGPGDIANPKGDDEPGPQGSDDIANPEGGDEPGPQGPDDKAGPNPGDSPEDAPENAPADVPADVPADEVPADVPAQYGTPDEIRGEVAGDIEVPNRIDAGAGDAEEEQGMSLLWVLAGGGVVTAAGSVLARRWRTQR